MPAYAYPIKIRPRRQTVYFEESFNVRKDSITLADLQPVGEDCFSVHEHDSGGYRIDILRSRLETDEERSSRVTKERAYMAEYNRRHTNTTPAT